MAEDKNNVINLFEARKKLEEKKNPKKKKMTKEEKDSYDFSQIMKENTKKREKLEKDRKKSNKGVKRSYRIDS